MGDSSLLKPLKHIRMYNDQTGESHLETIEIPQSPANAAPPAPLLHLSTYQLASRCVFYSAQPGWFGDWHPAPTRQFMVLLSGKVDVETSDGSTVNLVPGDIILVEDTWGKGHRSRNVSDTDFHFFVVQLPTVT